MKKTILSASLILAFILYGLHQRQEDKAAVVAVTAETPVATVSPAATSTPSAGGSSITPTPSPPGFYKDGTYTGPTADAFYGTVQVQAVISSGKITAVKFLQYPNDRSTSVQINQRATGELQQEAIQAQSAQVDGVSGASDTSAAFIQSLSGALSQAQ